MPSLRLLPHPLHRPRKASFTSVSGTVPKASRSTSSSWNPHRPKGAQGPESREPPCPERQFRPKTRPHIRPTLLPPAHPKAHRLVQHRAHARRPRPVSRSPERGSEDPCPRDKEANQGHEQSIPLLSATPLAVPEETTITATSNSLPLRSSEGLIGIRTPSTKVPKDLTHQAPKSQQAPHSGAENLRASGPVSSRNPERPPCVELQ